MAITESGDSIIKKVNTVKPLSITDEDRNKVLRSDVGNKMREQEQTTAKNQTKKDQLLADPDVKRWYQNTSRGSPLTAEMRLRRLSHFCEIHQITPIEFVNKDLRAITDLVQDHISLMEQQNKAPGYIESTVTAIKSWLRHFDIEIRRRIKIKEAELTPTLEYEKVPDQKEISEIFDRTTLRTAVEISLMAKAGLRPQVLGNHDGTDGLVLRDMSDIMIEDGRAICTSSPVRITVRRTLSKARHQYFTFLTENGTRKLLAYLNERLATGEKVTPDSPVIVPNTTYNINRGKNTGKKFLPTKTISRDIRETFRPRFKWRPYVLRAYFDTQLLMAEARGKIAHDFRVFFMGHKGSMEARYTTNKGLLPNALVTEMKNAFKRSQEFLDLELKTEEQFEMQTEMENATANHAMVSQQQPVQLVARLDQAEEMILQGWRLVATLPGEKAVYEYYGSRKRSV